MIQGTAKCTNVRGTRSPKGLPVKCCAGGDIVQSRVTIENKNDVLTVVYLQIMTAILEYIKRIHSETQGRKCWCRGGSLGLYHTTIVTYNFNM